MMRMSTVIQRWSYAKECTLAYDIRLLVNKGTVDIVRPQWVLDCVARDELVPLKKRYVIKVIPNQFRKFTSFTDTSFMRRTTDGCLLNTTNMIARMRRWTMKYRGHLENKTLT